MHTRHSLVRNALVAAAMVIPVAACDRNENATPIDQTQVQSPIRTANQPMTVTGCLRAGEAADTFVLTTGGTDVATYNLVGREGVNLADHVGRQVEVNGILTAQQQTAARAEAPAEGERTAGTSGTPTVATRTELDIRQLDVNTVRATGADCR